MSGRLKEGGVRVEYLLWLKPEEVEAVKERLRTDFYAPGIGPGRDIGLGPTVEVWRNPNSGEEVSISSDLSGIESSRLVRIAPVKHLNRPEQPQE